MSGGRKGTGWREFTMLRTIRVLWSKSPERVYTVRHSFCPMLQKREIEYTSAATHPIVGRLKLTQASDRCATPIGVFPWRCVLRIISQVARQVSSLLVLRALPCGPRISINRAQNNSSTECFGRDGTISVAMFLPSCVATRPGSAVAHCDKLPGHFFLGVA